MRTFGPIEHQLRPDGFAYSRELLEATIDVAADRVVVTCRVRVWESRYTASHWEYSHSYLTRTTFTASTGAFVSSDFLEPSRIILPD